MAISLSTASLMASSPSPSPSLRPRTRTPAASLASSSSLLFAHGRGGVALARRTLDLAPRRSRRGSGGLGCVCIFGLGVPELVVIAGVAALVFGPKQLPEIGRSIGKTVKSFQQAAKEFETELKKDPEDEAQPPLAESPKAISNKEVEKELEVSKPKES